MDEPLRELVRNWMTRASHDLRAASALADLETPPLDIAIYHCQQAAEKAIKGWLQGLDDPFTKTHNVVQLVKQACDSDASFSQLDDAAALLTPYAIAYRYPGGAYEPMPATEEFDEALQQAQRIFDFVLKRLPMEAKP